jgi:hypothetical protein
MKETIVALQTAVDSFIKDNSTRQWWRMKRRHLEQHDASPRGFPIKRTIRLVLGIWLAAVLLLGAAGAFARPPGTPPIPILIGAVVPLVVFLVAYGDSAAFRAFILTIDLPLTTAIQAWRAGGLGFLALYAHGILPGVFAWPAGLGDIAIGVTAPWIALALVRRRGFASSRLFVAWNLLGILDLIVAVGIGALSAVSVWGIAGEVTTGPMAQLPLVLIPAYLVPLFIMLHLAALLQSQHAEPAK